VFVGLVTSIEEDRVDIVRFGQKASIRTGLLAHFTIEEPLKGIKEKTIDVATGGGGGDCGYPFKSGERYLVYAYKSEGAALDSNISRTIIGGRSGMAAPLTASVCGRTRRLDAALDDVELIRALNAGRPETRIFGRISQSARRLGIYKYNIDSVGPLAGVLIKAEGASGQYEATTDSTGRYRFSGLRPGKYKIKVSLPNGFGPLFDLIGTVANAEITPETCGAEVDFSAQIDGRITGHVFDADGKPVADQVQVSIVSLESSGKGIALAESRSEYTKREGWYEFEGLLPGKYLLGVSIAEAPDKHSPYPTFYYQQTSDRAQAQVFTLAVGQKLKDIDLHLPAQLSRMTLSGVVLRSNGQPAIDTQVDIFDEEDPSRPLGFGVDVKTDKDGLFTIQCLKGRRYLLHAWKDQNYFAGAGEQSELIAVDTNTTAGSLKLVLSRPGLFIPQKTEN
jgi:protocatechuate 3,4-dioxygenase beta subunit